MASAHPLLLARTFILPGGLTMKPEFQKLFLNVMLLGALAGKLACLEALLQSVTASDDRVVVVSNRWACEAALCCPPRPKTVLIVLH